MTIKRFSLSFGFKTFGISSSSDVKRLSFLDFGEIFRRRRGKYFFAAGIWYTVIKNGESVQRKWLF